jgi:hypothetical protein
MPENGALIGSIGGIEALAKNRSLAAQDWDISRWCEVGIG